VAKVLIIKKRDINQKLSKNRIFMYCC